MSTTGNPFFIYCSVNRKVLSENNPDKSNSEISSILGAQWRKLIQSEKLKYQELALINRKVRNNIYLLHMHTYFVL